MASPQCHEARWDEVVQVVPSATAALLRVVSTWNETASREAWAAHDNHTLSRLTFRGKQRRMALKAKLPRVMTFHNLEIGHLACAISRVNSILSCYFCSWHCNYQWNTLECIVRSDILVLPLDVIWRPRLTVKPTACIRFTMERQLPIQCPAL